MCNVSAHPKMKRPTHTAIPPPSVLPAGPQSAPSGTSCQLSPGQHSSIVLRVTGRASVDRLHPSILPIQFEGLVLSVHGGAAFLPIVPRVPPAAKLPVWRDVPPPDVVPCATV